MRHGGVVLGLMAITATASGCARHAAPQAQAGFVLPATPVPVVVSALPDPMDRAGPGWRYPAAPERHVPRLPWEFYKATWTGVAPAS